MSKAWYKHYPSDWRSDKKLRLVSRAARSFWLDCVGVMHQEGTWRLEVNDRPITIKELAEVFGDNPRTAKKLLNELIEFNVCTVDSSGFVISRRVLRDFEKAEQDKSNGRMGGNPSLKTRENSINGVNPHVKAQKPEQEPYKKDTKVSTKKPNSKHSIPDKWQPPSDGIPYAINQGIPERMVQDEISGFIGYWADRTDAGGKKSDRGWLQCWKTNCRRVGPQAKRNSQMANGKQAFRNGQNPSLAAIVAERRNSDMGGNADRSQRDGSGQGDFIDGEFHATSD